MLLYRFFILITLKIFIHGLSNPPLKALSRVRNLALHQTQEPFHPMTYKAVCSQSMRQSISFISKITSALLISNALPIVSLSDTGPSPTDLQSYCNPSDITNKVYFDIKIANYTEESRGTNQAAAGSGRVVIGLFGKQAPHAVDIFMKTTVSSGDEDYPSFINAQISRVNEDGLIEVQKLRGLDLVSLAGSDQYEYKGKVITDFIPVVESNDFRHTIRGLLTKSQLSGNPEFAITTKANPALDQFHEVFGIVLSGYDVLDAIEAIPRYTYKTKTGRNNESDDMLSVLSG
jgi:cyclophilin family peptidyl-prolyl cis-trans isomerase